MTFLYNIGLYILMLQKMFQKPTKWRVMKDLILKDTEDTVVNSLGIISFVSFFIGGVITIQLALSTTGSFYPDYLVGYATRETIILEFAPTIISIIMAGKVGSFITSSLGTMRVTEQIDALQVMGINTYNYLIFPKIVAMLLYPFVITISMFLGIFGGYIASIYGGFCSSADFIEGIQLEFIPYHVRYAFVKTGFFAFILATVPSFHGYFLKGGALEVGKASTTSFVWTSVLIIVTNYIITQLLLA